MVEEKMVSAGTVATEYNATHDYSHVTAFLV
jgi:hypothetical protein